MLSLFSDKNVYLWIGCLQTRRFLSDDVTVTNPVCVSRIYALTHWEALFSLKAGFFSELKTRWSNPPQTLNQVFLAVFSAVLQLKKHHSRPYRPPRNAFWKWAWPILTWTKMKSSLEALLREFSKNIFPVDRQQNSWEDTSVHNLLFKVVCLKC